MDKQPRYYISRDGRALTDRRKNVTIPIDNFRLNRSGRLEIVLFNEKVPGKPQLKIARWTIDEKDFSFGETSPEATTHRRKRAAVHTDPPAAVQTDGKLIAFSKEELLELHESHLNAANLTLRKLAAHIKANG